MVDPARLLVAPPFEVGDVLGRSFAIWAKNLLPFGAISLVLTAPLLLMDLIASSGAPDSAAALAYGNIKGLLSQALALVVTGAVTYGVVMQMRQQPVSLAKAVSVGFSRVFSVIGVALTLFLMVTVPVLLLIFIAPLLAALVGLVITLAVSLVYWVAVPAAVVEKLGVAAALARSADLTRGHRFSIFLLFVVLGILSMVFGFFFVAIFASLGPLPFLVVTTLVVAFFLTSLGAVINAVGYQALRTGKEGVSLEDLAKVFD